MWLRIWVVLNLVCCCLNKHAISFWILPIEVSAGTSLPLAPAASVHLFIWMTPFCGARIHPAWISGRIRPPVIHARHRYSGCLPSRIYMGWIFSLKKINVNSCKQSPFFSAVQYLTILLQSYLTRSAEKWNLIFSFLRAISYAAYLIVSVNMMTRAHLSCAN